MPLKQFPHKSRRHLGTSLLPGNVTVAGAPNGRDLIISDGVAGDQITLSNLYQTQTYRVYHEKFTLIYGDGTQQVLSDTPAAFFSTTGTSGDETLYGSEGADAFDGHGGNDIEVGFGGNDSFTYNPGYGHLEINEINTGFNQSNILTLGSGIDSSQVVVSGDANNNLILTDGISGDQI